jgi:hypothetical protein
VDQNRTEIGQQAASLLLGLIEKGTNRNKPRVILLDPNLIARESSRGRTAGGDSGRQRKSLSAAALLEAVSRD